MLGRRHEPPERIGGVHVGPSPAGDGGDVAGRRIGRQLREERPGHYRRDRSGQQPPCGHRPRPGLAPVPRGQEDQRDQEEGCVVEVGEECEREGEAQPHRPLPRRPLVHHHDGEQPEWENLVVGQVVVTTQVEEPIRNEGEGRPGDERSAPALALMERQQVGEQGRGEDRRQQQNR